MDPISDPSVRHLHIRILLDLFLGHEGVTPRSMHGIPFASKASASRFALSSKIVPRMSFPNRWIPS